MPSQIKNLASFGTRALLTAWALVLAAPAGFT